MNKVKSLFREAVLLERSIPGIVSALFILSIVAMNLLANKSIALPFDWLALDCGIIFSWLVFLLMDMITKHFGPRAATMLSVIALIVNLFMALMFLLGSLIPGMWGESYVDGSEAVINFALDHTFRGTWYVLLGSSVAFIVSSIVNNELNWLIGKLAGRRAGDVTAGDATAGDAAPRGKSGFGVFALRSYVSTLIAQFIDNLVFALIVSHNFFGWTMTQCVMCAVTGAIVELLCEIIFSPIGYKVANRWKKKEVGKPYLTYMKEIGGRV